MSEAGTFPGVFSFDKVIGSRCPLCLDIFLHLPKSYSLLKVRCHFLLSSALIPRAKDGSLPVSPAPCLSLHRPCHRLMSCVSCFTSIPITSLAQHWALCLEQSGYSGSCPWNGWSMNARSHANKALLDFSLDHESGFRVMMIHQRQLFLWTKADQRKCSCQGQHSTSDGITREWQKDSSSWVLKDSFRICIKLQCNGHLIVSCRDCVQQTPS